VKARDSNPNHFDIAHVEITVTDANDEKPEFTKKVEVITRDENIQKCCKVDNPKQSIKFITVI
jgi:hypothetical protein